MSSPREREKRDRRESRGDEREGQGRKRNWNESEETEEIKTFPSTLTHYKDSRPCPTVSQYQLDAPVMKGPVLIPDFLCDLHRTSTPSVLQHRQIWRIEPQNGNVNKVFSVYIAEKVHQRV